MQKINIHEAKTHLSKLIEQATQGDSFVIAKAGKPMVLVVRYEPSGNSKPQRLGFLKNQFMVPDDFDRMGDREIEQMFSGKI